jgi:BirA family biotin operon repressor/biotin-[acetyl-CoA-carboxylase] ligase
LLDDGQLRTPALVLTELQTAGRGRGNNQWWARSGALTFSLVLGDHVAQLPTGNWPQVSLLTGLAVCQAIEQLVPELSVSVKWPNDVYIQGRKVCGILVDVPSNAAGRIVVGIGVNVNNSLTDAPDDIRSSAISLLDFAGKHHNLTDMLIQILVEFERLFDQLLAGDIGLAERWRMRCLLTGKRVCISTGNREIDGICCGIRPDGALDVDTASGREYFYSGVVMRYED